MYLSINPQGLAATPRVKSIIYNEVKKKHSHKMFLMFENI